MVRVGVQYGHPAQPVPLPESLYGDRDIVEAAVAAEKIPPGVVTSGADEGKGVDELPQPDPLGRRNHPSDRVARGPSEGILRDLPDEVGRVDLQDQLIGNRL